MSELHDLSAVEQAEAVRTRVVSPVEVLEHYLARIERLDARVGAFVTVTAAAARAGARRAEAAVRRGEPTAPLHGVPVPVKDLTATAGVRTTFGSAAFAAFVPDRDDDVVTRLTRAGTILLGKTNAPEFGLPCYTEPDVAPPARTPHDLDRSAGGSSGGAAAAVAAGLAPVAHGSDGGGSIRIPASACGLVGLKPSRGRITNGPLGGDLAGLGCHGVLARTVEDAAVLLDAMAGAEPGDSLWPPPPITSFRAATRRPPGRLTVGCYHRPVLSPDGAVHPECLAAFTAAIALMSGLGHRVEETDPPFGAELVSAFETVWAVGAGLTEVPATVEGRLRPLTRWLRARGRTVGGGQLAAAVVGLQRAARAALIAADRFDVVLTPTLADLPARVGQLRNDTDPAADFEAQKRFTPFTAAYNVTGQPAVSLPLHWTAEGLPVGIMLVGRPAGEETLLALAAELEAAAPWGHHRPALW